MRPRFSGAKHTETDWADGGRRSAAGGGCTRKREIKTSYIRNHPGRKTEKPPFGGFSHGFLSFGICGIGFWCTNTFCKNPVFPCALFVDTAANFMRREAPLRSNPCTEPTLLQVFCLMLRDPAGIRRGAYPAFPNCRPQSLHQRSCLLPTAAWIADAGHPCLQAHWGGVLPTPGCA